MTLEDIKQNPLSIAKTFLLHNEEITFRPLLNSDTEIFGKFLESLSKETRKRFGAHTLDANEAKNICDNLNYFEMFRLVSLNRSGEVIGYFILSFPFREEELNRYKDYGITINDKDVRLAPVIADEYQNKGLGSLMLQETLRVAKEIGLRHIVLWGGAQATNKRAIHFYEKAGFKKAGEFEKHEINNFDMYLEL